MSAIRYLDIVVLYEVPDLLPILRWIRLKVVVKGGDWRPEDGETVASEGDLNKPPLFSTWRRPAVTSFLQRHLATPRIRSLPLQDAGCH